MNSTTSSVEKKCPSFPSTVCDGNILLELRRTITLAAVEFDWLVQAKQGLPVKNATQEAIRGLSQSLNQWIEKSGLGVTKKPSVAPGLLSMFAETFRGEGAQVNTIDDLVPLIKKRAELLTKASQGEDLSEVDFQKMRDFCISLSKNASRVWNTFYEC